MTIKNHWGVMVNSEQPITGVVSNNAGVGILSEERFDDDAVDLAWVNHVKECGGQCGDCHCNHDGGKSECSCYDVPEGVLPSHAYDPQEDEHEFCGPQEPGLVLIGSWKQDADGKYEPDQNDPKGKGYAAISGELYTQVVWSKTTKRTRLCAPTFPGQGDLESVESGGEYLTYDLPKNIYGHEEG
jgi:hypothetical protein